MRVVYLDVYFMLNLWMNMLLLALTSALGRRYPGFFRLLFASLAGALASCMALFCERWIQLLGLAPVAFVINRICFPQLPLSKLLCRTFTYLALAALFGGLINWWYFEAGGRRGLSAGGMAVFSGMTALGIFIFLWFRQRLMKINRDMYQVLLSIQGYDLVTKGFLDSGNLLTDSLGRPVHIMEASFLYQQCPGLEHRIKSLPEGRESFQLGYKSLAGNGSIRVVAAERLAVPELGVDLKNPLIGLSEEPLFADGRCHMLLHGGLGHLVQQ